MIIDESKCVNGKGILKKIKPKWTKTVKFHEDVEIKEKVSKKKRNSQKKNPESHSKNVSSKETVKVIDLGSNEEVNDDVSHIYKTVDSHKLKGNKDGVTMDSEQNVNNNEKED